MDNEKMNIDKADAMCKAFLEENYYQTLEDSDKLSIAKGMILHSASTLESINEKLSSGNLKIEFSCY